MCVREKEMEGRQRWKRKGRKRKRRRETSREDEGKGREGRGEERRLLRVLTLPITEAEKPNHGLRFGALGWASIQPMCKSPELE